MVRGRVILPLAGATLALASSVAVAAPGKGGNGKARAKAPPTPAAICKRFDKLAAACEPLADVHMTRDECVLEFDPGSAPMTAVELGRCVMKPHTDCTELVSCIGNVIPDGLYKYSAATLDADCVSGAPSEASPLVGKPMRDFDGATPAGTPFKLSSLAGQPIVVVFTASWESSAPSDLLRLAQLRGAEVVVVLSGTDPVEVPRITKPLPASAHVVLDTGRGNLGAITDAWGIKLVPESVLIDRGGFVRYHFERAQDWSSAGAAACMKTLAR